MPSSSVHLCSFNGPSATTSFHYDSYIGKGMDGRLSLPGLTKENQGNNYMVEIRI
jgi:hypothetical protein